MIDIQTSEKANECSKCCLAKYFHPADYYPTRIKKIDKLCGDALDFEDIKFPVRSVIFSELKKEILLELVFLVIKEDKNIHIIFSQHVDLLLIEGIVALKLTVST